MKKIATSYDKDLRKNDWKVLETKQDGDIWTIKHEDTTGKKFVSKTRFAAYDDAFGKPVILYQEIWGEEHE